jgi:L-ascorbate metabolism protein UlaG (beta-lactamase superfamily)
MRITLDWLGVSTFRLMIDDLVIFLDGYIDRAPAVPRWESRPPKLSEPITF